jgi:hypothetical protein
MFGQQNNQPATDQIPDQSIDGVLQDQQQAVPAPAAPAVPATDAQQDDWQHPGVPLDADKANYVEPAVPKPLYGADTPVDPTYAANDLMAIKQQALSELSPLVGHLDQSPEEKFRTTMMMIQASDDQTLVKTAHEAAMQITDEKAKAQALLDIVNEINYFTAQHPDA